MTYQGFIQPCDQPHEIEALIARCEPHIRSGYRSLTEAEPLLGQNRIFDRIVARQQEVEFACEDQCSARYYFDLVRTLRDFNGDFDRVVEVGVFMGGSSAYLAGCSEAFDFDIDMVDVNAHYLRFAYERVRRLYPEAAKRIRLFHGDLPTYVRHVMLGEAQRRSIVHHDGAHDFNQVVKDMAALSFAQPDVVAVIAQDTHLRGSLDQMNFVDLALYAVFGTDLKFAPIGSVYDPGHHGTRPDQWFGNYFMPGVAEGLVLPMAANRFLYPHPHHDMDDFLPFLPETVAAAA